MKFALLSSILLTYFNIFTNAMQNGEYRSVKDYPFVAQLYFEYVGGSMSFCSATILSEYWVITAAHCVGNEGTIKYQVRVGTSITIGHGVTIDIEQVFVHGDYYEDFAHDNDIALVKLKTPIEFNEYQQRVQIAKESPQIGDNVTLLGFGNHHHLVDGIGLRVAETPIIANKFCLQKYNLEYTKNMICTRAKYIDLCYGDSGGTAVYNNKLIGIIAQGCEYKKPNILTKVVNYYDWIMETTGIKYDD